MHVNDPFLLFKIQIMFPGYRLLHILLIINM